MSRIEEILTISPVIPVIVIDDINDAVPLAQALVNGGLRVLEVTLRSEVALAAISRIIQAVPEAIVGAGTVLCMEDLSKAIAAGSRFLVSPGSTATLVDAALQQSIPFLPGVATSSEALNLPTVRHRGTFAEVDDRAGGLRRVTQSPYRFSDALSEVRGGAPHQGEHNEAVLDDWLQPDGEQRARWRSAMLPAET